MTSLEIISNVCSMRFERPSINNMLQGAKVTIATQNEFEESQVEVAAGADTSTSVSDNFSESEDGEKAEL